MIEVVCVLMPVRDAVTLTVPVPILVVRRLLVQEAKLVTVT